MIAVPTPAPVTIPDVPTVATDVLLLLHVPLAVASVNVVVLPLQTDKVPAIGATVILLTVTEYVTTFVKQLLDTEYEITSLPRVTPVTVPELLIVAIEVNLLLHVPPLIRSVKGMVDPMATLVGPVIGDVVGWAVTFTVAVVPQPEGIV